jgi:hypothetical protein
MTRQDGNWLRCLGHGGGVIGRTSNPHFSSLAHGMGTIERTSGREGLVSAAEQGIFTKARQYGNHGAAK